MLEMRTSPFKDQKKVEYNGHLLPLRTYVKNYKLAHPTLSDQQVDMHLRAITGNEEVVSVTKPNGGPLMSRDDPSVQMTKNTHIFP